MKAALLWLMLSTGAFAQAGREVILSPQKQWTVEYEWSVDEPTGTEYSHKAVLKHQGGTAWSFSAKGRAMVFSWSPDGRYLLVGVVLPARDMALYYVDTIEKPMREHDLNLKTVREFVEASLPKRKDGSFAGRSQVDFDSVRWLSDSECQLDYHYCFDRKSGDAGLRLDLTVPAPSLKVLAGTPSP